MLITAGPTWEALDPVRGLSNKSSGKMGFAIAEAALEMGADVHLISGPVCLKCSDAITRTDIESALEMYDAVQAQVPDADIFIAVAAVADYRPQIAAEQKIKKTANNDTLELTLVKNPDILASVGKRTTNRPYTVGFAAETHDVATYARAKRLSKQADLIAANNVSAQAAGGFGSDFNQLTLYGAHSEQVLEFGSKAGLAQQLLTFIAAHTDKQI